MEHAMLGVFLTDMTLNEFIYKRTEVTDVASRIRKGRLSTYDRMRRLDEDCK